MSVEAARGYSCTRQLARVRQRRAPHSGRWITSAEVRELKARGVVFEKYDMPGIKIGNAGNGTRRACAISRLRLPLGRDFWNSCAARQSVDRVLSIIAFYEKVIKVNADVAAFLINCFSSA